MEEADQYRKRLGLRFAKARAMLGLSKGQAASPCELLPRDIAQIEDGTKKFVPTPYLQFLSKRIDLNSLFDEAMEVRLRHDSGVEIPALDALRANTNHIQSVAAPPPWLSELLQMNRLVQEMNGRIQRLEDERGKKGPPAESKAS